MADSPESFPVDEDERRFALTMLACPYYTQTGICQTGCRDEPWCVTGEPNGGWAALAGSEAD